MAQLPRQHPVGGLSVPEVFPQCLGAKNDAWGLQASLGNGLVTLWGNRDVWAELIAVAKLSGGDGLRWTLENGRISEGAWHSG